MRSCVVVLNWNAAPDTLRCIRSILDSSASEFGVVVVDNGSTDESVEVLQDWYDASAPMHQVRVDSGGNQFLEAEISSQHCSYLALLLLTDNGGYGAGNNAGLRLAKARGAQYAWILNNDTTIERDTLLRLENFADSCINIGVVGTLVVDMEAPQRIQYLGGGRFNALTTRNVLLHSGEEKAKVSDDFTALTPDYVGGASMFCSLPALHRVGYLAEDYFLFYEELDLCQRLRRAGYGLAVEPSAVVYHRGGATSGATRSLQTKSSLAAFHGSRSAMIYLSRFHPRALPMALMVRAAYATVLVATHPTLGMATVRGLWAGVMALRTAHRE